MKLSKFKEDSYWFSAKASDIARQLAFAGIAIIWIFKVTDRDILNIPDALVLPTILFSISLACDLLQYITGTIIWSIFHRCHEKKSETGTDPEITASPYLNYPNWILFALKIMLVFWAYIEILIYLFGIWQFKKPG